MKAVINLEGTGTKSTVKLDGVAVKGLVGVMVSQNLGEPPRVDLAMRHTDALRLAVDVPVVHILTTTTGLPELLDVGARAADELEQQSRLDCFNPDKSAQLLRLGAELRAALATFAKPTTNQEEVTDA